MDPAAFERVLEVNVLGVHRTVHAALPHVVANGGHVVVVASIYAFVNGVLLAPYAMSKAAVEQYGRALRAELAQHGASASVAYFGFIDTDMVREGFGSDPRPALRGHFPRFLRKQLQPSDGRRRDRGRHRATSAADHRAQALAHAYSVLRGRSTRLDRRTQPPGAQAVQDADLPTQRNPADPGASCARPTRPAEEPLSAPCSRRGSGPAGPR